MPHVRSSLSVQLQKKIDLPLINDKVLCLQSHLLSALLSFLVRVLVAIFVFMMDDGWTIPTIFTARNEFGAR